MLAGLRREGAAPISRACCAARLRATCPTRRGCAGSRVPALVIATRGDRGHPLSTAERLRRAPAERGAARDRQPGSSSARCATKLARVPEPRRAPASRARAPTRSTSTRPTSYAAGAPYADFSAAAPRAAVRLAADTGRWRLLGAHEHADVAEVSRDPERVLLGARASW